MAGSKQCFKCKQEKAMEQFYRHPKMADGRLNKCADCTRADVTANRLAKIDKYREYDRERGKEPERKAAASAVSKRWLQADPRRMSAHNALHRAVRAGTVIKKPCERCGKAKAYAHHESYDRKLDVVWLCQPCHKQRHKEMAIEGVIP